ncbi:MAG: ATP-dependent helicase [Epsilonproteobacteria bacterium]|nr:ATP-dependent helicase [Campylobacterota bacterium]OIO18121.1 MAG: ATP-dependent helicase [Helicobacteraceae bacterium CG1_02_36_14]PIP11220.1 MAG: ATP-dependent helicase [Sulfurimonas sp. CG23_combo_of_CG06-09_8_20_14_all_36_33]PIS23622.1 MAG: ATP-dependent helicase [Sulfurimonas sp. CG08_land_8_20_14_0_20_36_33]PIU35214.1 MAG: ATP-dependent helicase [Sulfurimonas sp. CG07_land_8_20_14_0_80_36_56]PIV04495.1 MAG: ATP-dependent helicase [Sulfurimonas sp. CG03_land_8_20_14_0_80_36_25]PIV3680
MTNIVEVTYNQTGESKKTNSFGMRDMQEKAYNARNEQYLLLKAPPASGKSRALMFIALDKLYHQNINKVIVAVPERSIGGSFGVTDLKKDGFFASWEPNPIYNLCSGDADKSKVEAFKKFMESDEKILICTHATLRFAFKELDEKKFDNCLLAIDEFHHVSADGENQLGELLRTLIPNSTAHIVAMTGSYFRGDSVPVLLPEDEAKFAKVTYNYYEQLNGYEHLKSLGIGYHFYQGRYTSAIADILDTDKKTILHIPNVNSGESTKDKHKEVDTILDIIGTVIRTTEDGIIIVKRESDGKFIKVADLVNDDQKTRDKVVSYLRNIKSMDDMDLIIALGMAKEGFDWPFCEHALTVGYRSSLTEIIQIIGRATRDSDNKTHAQFTNLIAQPDAEDLEVKLSVNNMLKAITASLLMEQVLAPNFKFKPRFENDTEPHKKGEFKIRGFKPASTKRVENILESDLNDLKATILQDEQMIKAIPGNLDAEVINRVLIPKIIKVKYPDLSDAEVEEVRQYVVVDSVIKNGQIIESGDKKFIKMADKFVNIDELHIDLIDQINPFQRAFEILSKSVTTHVLKLIQESIEATRIEMTPEEAVILYKKIPTFQSEHGRLPNVESQDFNEKRMAEALIYLNKLRREKANG